MFEIGFIGKRKEGRGRNAVGYFLFGVLEVQWTRMIRKLMKYWTVT